MQKKEANLFNFNIKNENGKLQDGLGTSYDQKIEVINKNSLRTKPIHQMLLFAKIMADQIKTTGVFFPIVKNMVKVCFGILKKHADTRTSESQRNSQGW